KVLGRQGRLGLRYLRFMKTIQKVADANLVVILQRQPGGDRLIVDIGAVAAAHIFYEKLVLHAQDAGMLAADGEVIGGKDDIAIGIPAKDEPILVQRNALLGVDPFK